MKEVINFAGSVASIIGFTSLIIGWYMQHVEYVKTLYNVRNEWTKPRVSYDHVTKTRTTYYGYENPIMIMNRISKPFLFSGLLARIIGRVKNLPYIPNQAKIMSAIFILEDQIKVLNNRRTPTDRQSKQDTNMITAIRKTMTNLKGYYLGVLYGDEDKKPRKVLIMHLNAHDDKLTFLSERKSVVSIKHPVELYMELNKHLRICKIPQNVKSYA